MNDHHAPRPLQVGDRVISNTSDKYHGFTGHVRAIGPEGVSVQLDGDIDTTRYDRDELTVLIDPKDQENAHDQAEDVAAPSSNWKSVECPNCARHWYDPWQSYNYPGSDCDAGECICVGCEDGNCTFDHRDARRRWREYFRRAMSRS